MSKLLIPAFSLALVLGAASTAFAARYTNAHLVDAVQLKSAYESNQVALKQAGDQRKAWKKRRDEAAKKGETFTEPEPARVDEIFDVTIYPEAVDRANAVYAEREAAYQAAKKAWKAADPATRGEKPQAPHRPKVEVRDSDTLGVKSTEGYREPLYGRIWFHPVRATYDFPKVGSYRVWVRYWRSANSPAQMALRVIAPSGETCRFEILNRIANVHESPNQEGRTIQVSCAAGWEWVSVPFNAEATGAYTFNIEAFDRNVPSSIKLTNSTFAIGDVWVSDDPAFDPRKGSVTPSVADADSSVPSGFIAATRHPTHANLNMAVRDSQKRLLTNFMESYGWYGDLPALVQLGAVDTYSSGSRKENAPLGLSFQEDVQLSRRGDKPPKVEIKEDEDWWSYRARKNAYALSVAEESVKRTLEKPDDDLLACWWTAWEECGSYDYGESSCREYRLFLKTKHGSIEKLNEAWRSNYASFDEIEPAKWSEFYGAEYHDDQKALKRLASKYASRPKVADGETDAVADEYFAFLKKHADFEAYRHRQMANFVDFRDFRSKVYALNIGVKTQAVMKHDTHGPNGGPRHVSSNLSANNVASVMWMQWRPLCFEDTAQITMKGSDMIGYDNYGTDDVMGSFYEIFDSFGDGKLRPMVREGSTHAPQPEVYARTIWGNIAKGMRGMDTFVAQESGNRSNQGELAKFGLMNMYDDAAPRPKLAAASDIYRAMHQLDHLLSETKRVRAVKPIAIYYSSVCNLLQERPYASIFDPGPDNFFRVYELMHANGYPVTFVTDRQIREGGDWMKSLKAIVFIDATYIPRDVQKKVMDWVEAGGHIFADAQSGTCDEYSYPTEEFTKWLVIRPVQQQRVADDAAAKLSFGYSSYAFDVINRDEIYQTSCEIKEAPGEEHPISKLLGKTMLSAMGYNEILCTDGHVVLQENNARPYMTVRDHGKGSSVYFAGYAGTMFGAGCTQYEWRDKHSDNSPYRVMDAWLTWIGAEKIEVNDLPRDMAYSMRFESPLVDARGNAFMGIASELPCDVPSFRVCYRMPACFKAPKMCLAMSNSSRKLTPVKFSYDEKKRELTARIPGFGVWSSLLALNDLEPLVSVEFEDEDGLKRDAYGLVDMRPGDVVEAEVRVINPSGRKLKDGEIELRLPDGWFCNREKKTISSIGAYSISDDVSFKIMAPRVNCARRLKPINFVYRHASLPNGSGPAVEMVWFQKEPQNLPAKVFDVK